MRYLNDFLLKQLKAITFALFVVFGFALTLPLESHRYDLLLIYVIIVQFFYIKLVLKVKKIL